jgi:TolB protein
MGCTGQGASPTSPPAPVASAKAGDLSGPGRLAYIGRDGNVYVTTADRQRTVAVTDDATTALEGEGRSYHRLSWSPQGELAFAAVERNGAQARSQLYRVEIPGGEPELILRNDEHFLIYLYWAPVPCGRSGDCRRLAYLVNEGADIGLHVLDTDQGGVADLLAEVGRPVYFSWSPTGDRLLLHTGGNKTSDSPAAVSLYDVTKDTLQEVPLQMGDFQSPDWFLGGERWLGVHRENDSNRLKSFQGLNLEVSQPASSAVVEADEEIVFSMSPGGGRIAYAVRGSDRAPYYGPVHIFNLETEATQQVTPDELPTLGFFWSPRGERLGYLTRLVVDQTLWMQWRVAQVENGDDRGYQVFRPTPAMEFIVQSFTQYAHSHRFWSPDGRYLVYADRSAGANGGSNSGPLDRVWLIDTWAENDEEPLPVSGGSFGVWSWK